MFNFNLPITRDNILKKISEEDIFEKYLGIKPDYGKQFCNPLREDKNPGCQFYLDSRNRIKFIDPARGFNWDCFNVVEYLEKTTFKEAIKIVAVDFSLIDGRRSNPVIARQVAQKEKVGIRIKRRDWILDDAHYWHTKYYQTRIDLQFHTTFPVSHAWYERVGVLELFYYHKPGDPCYAYHFGNYDYKLYFPFREKGNRFRQTKGDIIQGLQQLPEKGHILIITKSFKDVMCINKLGKPYGIYAIAPMSETQVISKEIIDNLMLRFDYVFTLFDFDRTGITLLRKYEKQYNIPWLLFGKKFKIQGIKDFADHLDIKRYDNTIELIKLVYNERIG